MIRGSLNYRRPKNPELEAEISALLSKHSGIKLGEFGINDGQFELQIGFKKIQSVTSFEKEIRELSNRTRHTIQITIIKPREEI